MTRKRGALRDRNASERMFCRLKDFRRIATRYDKLATNFRHAIRLVAVVLVASRLCHGNGSVSRFAG
jgi:transposase